MSVKQKTEFRKPVANSTASITVTVNPLLLKKVNTFAE